MDLFLVQAFVNTDFRSSLSLLLLSMLSFLPTSAIPRKLIFMGPIRNMKKNNFTKADFPLCFLLFTASVQSRKPGPTLVPGVLETFHQLPPYSEGFGDVIVNFNNNALM